MSYEAGTTTSPNTPEGAASIETVIDDLALEGDSPGAAIATDCASPSHPASEEPPVDGHPIADLTPSDGEVAIAVRVAGMSIPGRRIANEDTIHFEAREVAPGHLRAAIAIADGGSELNSGSLASKMAIGKFRAGAQHVARDATIEPSLLLAHACKRAHEGIREAIEERRAMGRPFSSFLGAYVVDNGFAIGHIGNSRAYLVRRDRVIALTRDHEPIEPVAGPGGWDAADAVRPSRHLGSDGPCEVEILPAPERYFRVQAGEVLVLCSDGLSGVIDGEKVREVLTRTQSIEEACELLASLALVKGSNDNVSIVCAEFGHLPRRARSAPAASGRPFRPVRSGTSANLPLGKVAAAAALIVSLVIGGSVVKRAQVNRALTPIAPAHEMASVRDAAAPSTVDANEMSSGSGAIVGEIEWSSEASPGGELAEASVAGDPGTPPDQALLAMTASAPASSTATPVGENAVAGADGPEAGPLPAEDRQEAESVRPTASRSASSSARRPTRSGHAMAVRPTVPTVSAALSGRRVSPPADLPALPRSGGAMSGAPSGSASRD